MIVSLCCEEHFHCKRLYFDFRVSCWHPLTCLLYLIWKLHAEGNNPVMLIICSNPQWCLQKRRPPIIHRCPPHSVWVKQCPPRCLITRPSYFCSCTFKIQLFSFSKFFFSRALFFRALLMHNSFPLFFGSAFYPGRLQDSRLGSQPA